MNKPEIVQKAPYVVDVESGRTYFWCACGKSQNQPYCDGSHKGSDFVPVKFEAGRDETVFFCGCKHSANAPMCDGSHNKLD